VWSLVADETTALSVVTPDARALSKTELAKRLLTLCERRDTLESKRASALEVVAKIEGDIQTLVDEIEEIEDELVSTIKTKRRRKKKPKLKPKSSSNDAERRNELVSKIIEVLRTSGTWMSIEAIREALVELGESREGLKSLPWVVGAIKRRGDLEARNDGRVSEYRYASST